MLAPCKNPPGHKEDVILFVFHFLEGVTIVDWIENMNPYVSNIVKSYEDTIIGYMGKSGATYLALHIVQRWCEFYLENEQNQALPVIIYCYVVVYLYYSGLEFAPIKHKEKVNDIHKGEF